MKPSEVLAKAADLIEPEGRWTQSAAARDSQGTWVTSRDPRAVCWCAIGALNRAGDDLVLSSVAAGFVRDLIGDAVGSWNDTKGRTQAEVVKALRDASELAKAEGK